jgi:hypothetical protein
MRLKSDVWVGAFLRIEASAGGFPAVIRRGAAEAGAVFIRHDHPDQTVTVYAPAPQAAYGDDPSPERNFEIVLERVDAAAAAEYFERQIRFDGDCWIVGTERRDGPPNLLL